jgi:hypothetical protein
MADFIRKIVAGHERIIVLTHLHWIYLLEGTLWFMGISIAGIRLDHKLLELVGPPIAVLAFLAKLGLPVTVNTPLVSGCFVFVGLCVAAIYLFKYLGTEIGLTTQRIIYKTGLLFVETQEVDLVEIRSETVHHGILGRFLGYGRVKLDSRFVGDTNLPAVGNPYHLLKAINAARTQVHDPMVDAVPGDASPHAETAHPHAGDPQTRH